LGANLSGRLPLPAPWPRRSAKEKNTALAEGFPVFKMVTKPEFNGGESGVGPQNFLAVNLDPVG
jgi:hypothetical protein